MDFDIAVLIAQDGIASGAIYAMMALGIVLVFNATRVVFVPFGDLVAFAALTLGNLQLGQRPGTIWLLGVLAVLAFAFEAASLLGRGQAHRLPRAALVWLLLPLLPVAIGLAVEPRSLPLAAQIALSIALTLPLGPLLYRIVFQPAASAPILILLTMAVALHFAISGLALLAFGPEGLRTRPLLRADLVLGDLLVSGQMLLMLGASTVISLALFVLFSRSIVGKALRATAMNRDGARLVGIRTTRAGAVAFLLASLIAAVSGILISPTTTIYYDTGFMVGLKGFVGATVGGFVGYPAAVIGALLVGLIESVSSFYASALKDVIVFASIIPIVLWRWLATGSSRSHDEEEPE